MHSRRPAMNLVPDSASGPARVSGNKIIHLPGKRRGLSDVVASIPADAEERRGTGRQESSQEPDNVIVGLPKVETFEASDCTFREIAAKAA
jgi:hypothetical protein